MKERDLEAISYDDIVSKFYCVCLLHQTNGQGYERIPKSPIVWLVLTFSLSLSFALHAAVMGKVEVSSQR